jgi:hypothetical protein
MKTDKKYSSIPLLLVLLLVGLIYFLSVKRTNVLNLEIVNSRCRLYLDKNLVFDEVLSNNISSDLISVSVIHDREFRLIPFPFRKETLEITSLSNNIKESAILNLLKNDRHIMNRPFSGEVSFDNQSLTSEYKSKYRYDNFRLIMKTVNPETITVDLGPVNVWSRPIWNQENTFIFYLKLIASKIALNLIAGILIFLILSCLARCLFSTIKKLPQTDIAINKACSYIFRQDVKIIICLALLIYLLVVYIESNILENFPHSQDEVAYIFQSKIFASGQLFLQSLPGNLGRFFDHEFIVNNGKWFGKYPSGYPLFLAFGNLVKFPQLINPLFYFFSVLFLFLLTKRLYSSKEAVLTIVIMLFSPFYLLISGSYFSHSASLLFTITTLLFFLSNRYVISGFFLGLLLITRPFNAFILGVCLLFLLIYRLIYSLNRKKYLLNYIKISIMPLFFVLVTCTYNKILSGSFFKFPFNVYSPFDTLGFGARGVEWSTTFTPLVSLKNFTFNFYSLLDMINGWPYWIAFCFIAFSFFSKDRKRSLGLIILFILQVAVYSFYHAKGTFYGPRYWYEVSFILIILNAKGVIYIYDFLKAKFNQATAFVSISALTFFISFIAVTNLYRTLPGYKGYNGMTRPASLNISTPAIVFIPGQINWQSYGRYFTLFNPARLDENEIVFARDKALHNVPKNLAPLDNELLEEYLPNRKSYIILGEKKILEK